MTDNPSTTSAPAPQCRIGESEDNWTKGSITKTYYRLTVREASEYYNGLSPKNQVKLQSDEKRVQKIRARLSRLEAKGRQDEDEKGQHKEKEVLEEHRKGHLQRLHDALRQWREEAWQKKDPNKRLKNPFGERGNGPEGNLFKKPLCQDHGDNEGIDGNDNPSHELKTVVMFFEKSENGCWKGVTHHEQPFSEHEQFPGQKLTVHEALYGEKYNPFAPTYNKNRQQLLKYIHLPANHMGVSSNASLLPLQITLTIY